MKQKCLVVLVFVVLLACAVGWDDGIPGGWNPIKNINDPHVTEIANFAVTEYDKQSGEKLKLVKVIKGDLQVVAGLNYRLSLTASDSNNYQAIVYEKAWAREHYRNLTSFTPLHA
ncbi:hypothetical protein JHK87_019825 [Glycine soja]|nr:hypothetical protein JHK87_019825 [Glycine soja]